MIRKQLRLDFSEVIQSTLADSSWGSVFADENVAGLAAQSLTLAIVSSYIEKIGKVIKVIPQKYEALPGIRSSRVDIEVLSDNNELVIYEIQILYDKALDNRNFLAYAINAASTLPIGTPAHELPDKMPRVIFINILCYNVRDDNSDVVQHSTMCYTNPPMKVSSTQIRRFEVQMPQFVELVRANKVDFTKPLHCWLYTIWTAHEKQITPGKVVEMNTALQEFAKTDEGFRQFCTRFKYVTDDPQSRKDYAKWLDETWRQMSIVESALDDNNEYWQDVVAEKDAALADKDAALADKDAALARALARIAELEVK